MHHQINLDFYNPLGSLNLVLIICFYRLRIEKTTIEQYHFLSYFQVVEVSPKISLTLYKTILEHFTCPVNSETRSRMDGSSLIRTLVFFWFVSVVFAASELAKRDVHRIVIKTNRKPRSHKSHRHHHHDYRSDEDEEDSYEKHSSRGRHKNRAKHGSGEKDSGSEEAHYYHNHSHEDSREHYRHKVKWSFIMALFLLATGTCSMLFKG